MNLIWVFISTVVLCVSAIALFCLAVAIIATIMSWWARHQAWRDIDTTDRYGDINRR
jgi:hypothetical protein